MAPPVVDVQYRGWGAMQRDVREQFARRGYFIRVDLGLEQHAAVVLHVRAPDGATYVLSCEVVSVVPGVATSVQVGRSTAPAVLRDLQALAQGRPPEAPEAGDPRVVVAAVEVASPSLEGFDVDMSDDADSKV